MTYSGPGNPNPDIPFITGDPEDPNTPTTVVGEAAIPGTYTSPEEEKEQLFESYKRQPGEDREAYRKRVGIGKQPDESWGDYHRRKRIYFDYQGIGADMEAMVSKEATEVAALAPIGIVDLALDAVGKFGEGGASIDDMWDEKTRFSSEYTRNLRDISGVITPTIAATALLGPAAGAAVQKLGGGAILKGLATAGTTAAVDMSVVGISDYSERDEGMLSALDGWLDSMGNPLGMNIPDAAKVMDGDDPAVRRLKLMLEAGTFSIVADALGYLLTKGKPNLGWFKPKDDAAKAFKAEKQLENPDPASAKAVSDIEDQIEENVSAMEAVKDRNPTQEITDALNAMFAKRDRNFSEEISVALAGKTTRNYGEEIREFLNNDTSGLINKKERIIADTRDFGRSEATVDPLESHVAKQQALRDYQQADAAGRKILEDPWDETFDPDKQPLFADPSQTAARFSVPPASVARNAADIAAENITFKVPSSGVPTPMLTEPMMRDGLGLTEDTRDQVIKLTNESKAAGQYEAEIRKTKISQEDLEESSFKLMADMIAAPSVDDLKNIIIPRKRSQSYVIGGEEIAALTPADAPAAGRAMKALLETYLGPDVQQTSARLLHTTSKEIEVLAEAFDKFKGVVDPDRMTDVIIDKATFLAGEYGLQKYLWGWQGQNLKWWDKIARGLKSPQELMTELNQARTQVKAQTNKLNADLKRLMSENPQAAYNLAMAYDLTGGKVADQVALTKWFQKQTNLKSMLINLEGDPTIIGGIARAIRFNNVLSGLAAAKAFVGNATALVMKPAEYMMGAGIHFLKDGDMSQLRRGLYAFNSFDMHGEALSDAYEMWKRANKDPRSVMKNVRADYQYTDEAKWEVLDRLEDQYMKEGKKGDAFIISKMRQARDLALSPWMRWGTNAMLAIDTYTNTMLATANSKFRAWDEVTTAGRKFDAKNLEDAYQKHYSQVFDKDGVIKDDWLRQTSGEVALNADDGIAQALTDLTNRVPGLLPFMMFPRTGINWVKKSLTYTPIQALVPGKHQKLLLAGNDDDKIREALIAFGFKPDNEPQYRLIYENLKNEYRGRIAMGTALMGGLMHQALAGNIRGNLPPQKADQQFWRKNDIQPKTIKIGGNWVSYDGIIPFDPLLTFIGDIAYHQRDIGEAASQDWIGKMLWTVTESFVSSTPLGGLDTLVDIANPSSDHSAAWKRFAANEVRSYIPMSGALGVGANLINSTQKDIYDDFWAYLGNRLPFVNTTLPDQIDVWTGEPIKEYTNPMLRIFNAVSPIKVTEGEEEWRTWLLNSGFDGIAALRKDSTGHIEYTPEQRNIIMRYMGQDQLWKEVENMSKRSDYNNFIEKMRYNTQNGASASEIQLQQEVGPVYTHLRRILKQSQERAELKAIANGDIAIDTREGAAIAKRYLRMGDIDSAIRIQKQHQKR